MSYKCFLFLTCCLRFDYITTKVEIRKVDKLAAIRPFRDAFAHNSNKNTTFDEILHPLKSRCSWVQYISSKPSKYGIKIYVV